MTDLNFTENEKAIFLASRDNDYANVFDDGCTWTFAIIDSSGLSPQVARGVISSLVKKGVVEIDDYGSIYPDGSKPKNDTIFAYTAVGKELAFLALKDA